MRFLPIVLWFIAACAFAQTAEPELAQIKIAADAGDPVAQDKLAERFIMRLDSAQAETWYRKAAGQGYAHAQGRLGNMLLMRSRMTVGLKPVARAVMEQEALKWIILAANQGDIRGQADFADVCLSGKLVKQDLIEAYKWGELSTQGSMIDVATISGRSVRDAAILKMNADQIAEARRRVAAFVPHSTPKSELPDPAWFQSLKLNGISGRPDRRFAVINQKTFGKGDLIPLKVGDKLVPVRCVEIRESSVIISAEGLDGTRELKMR